MAVTTNNRFNFVSPGISIQEIDNSQLPATPAEIGPVIIGRTQRGPAMVPVTIHSFSDFVEIFGNPVPGGQGGDVWRDGNFTAPMYAAYAAQAWLKNSNTATIVRLMGHESPTNPTGTRAGWTMGGAYGVYIFSASNSTSVTGTLGAVIYTNSGTTIWGTASQSANNGVLAAFPTSSFVGPTSGGNFSLVVSGSSTQQKLDFNFDPTSPFFIRKVLNCNPIATNSDVTSTVIPYFLGESFEEHIANNIQTVGAILIAPVALNNKQSAATDSLSPWIFSQDIGTYSAYNPLGTTPPQALFQFADLYSGESTQRAIKISIQDISPATNPQYNPYGTFTVVVRKWDDTDASPKILEKFVGLNLDSSSPNFIATVIGDQYLEWSEADRNYRVKNSNPNNSKFIRVIMDPIFDAAGDVANLLPFGFKNAPKYLNHTGSSSLTGGIFASVAPLSGSGPSFKIQYPEVAYRSSGTQGNLPSQTNAYFGVTYTKNDFVTPYAGTTDLLGLVPSAVAGQTTNTYFSLDCISSSAGVFTNTVGSRAAGTSITAISGSSYLLQTSKINRFTVPMFGGFDGLNVTQMDPFNDAILTAATGDKNSTCAPYYSIGKAIAAVSDPERVEMNILTIPGITTVGITDQMINVCEARTDALAIIDIPGIYIPRAQTKTGFGPQFSLDTCVSTFKGRATNSSYACTYYPWLKVVDTINGNQLWAPPSVAMLGVLSSVDKKADPWFAPAGFTRGGLTEGAAGIPVVAVCEQLTAKQRDKLYEANINPIAQFPTEGIVVYGQKTLQVTKSALDRINVRRMLIYVKREISKIAATTLFEPDVQTTWTIFSGRCTEVLSSVKARLGIADFKLVLDETTTTPDLVDRNIMYAKIYLKPVKAIEFIAVDFVITNAGASFED